MGIDRLYPDLTEAVAALDEPTREAVRVTEDTSERVLHLFDAHGQSRPPQEQINQNKGASPQPGRAARGTPPPDSKERRCRGV